MRRSAGELLEQSRKVKWREIRRGGERFQCEILIELSVHQLNRAANAPVDQTDA